MTALLIAVAVGVLVGVATNHGAANRHLFGEGVAVLGGVVLFLLLLGGFLAYRGTGGFPQGWADDQ